MESYKLLALDMDGTLLNEAKEISAENRKWIALAREAGITVTIATGRGMRTLAPYIEELGLQSPLVTVNGGEVWQSPERLYRRHLLPAELVRRLRQIALDFDIWYWAYAVEDIYNRDHWINENESLQWLKFGFYTEREPVRREIVETVSRWGNLEITNSDPNNLELNPKGVTKESGLREVCRLLNIEMKQVVAVGDSLNDLSMVRAAGLGVAMGNAQEALKRSADWVTSSNEENGVAEVIKTYMLT